MAGERRINFGADSTDARYAIEDTGDGANFVLANDTTVGTVLLEWDDTAGEWVVRGPVNMSGNDLSNVGAVDATSLSTDNAAIGSNWSISDSDEITRSNVPVGSLVELLTADAGSQNSTFVSQATADVSTSAKTILSDIELGAVALVVGKSEASVTDQFADLVLSINVSGATTVASQERNTPATRSYSVANVDDLQLAMGSDTYNIMVAGISAVV